MNTPVHSAGARPGSPDIGDACGGKQRPHPAAGASGSSASWRYTSISNSADSDTYSGLLASVAADTGTGGLAEAVAAAGISPSHSDPRSTPRPAGHAATATAAPHGTDTASQQLWSPIKRSQQHAYEPSGGSGASSGELSVGVPPGLDAASYAAGERAALMRAFQQALPGQQALGQLFSAVDALHSRLEEEAGQWRQLQLGASKTSAVVEAALQRLDTVEFMRLPQLQEQAEAAGSRPPEQLLELMSSLQQAVTLLAQQRQLLTERQVAAAAAPPPLRPRSIGALHWLLLAGAGYGQSVLSRADVAALFLSRKILLSPTDGEEELDGSGSRRRLLSSGVSVLLFVASVEAAWQAQQRVLRPLPVAAQRAAAPLQLGLRVARAAVWSAALVLAAAQTRAACHAAGDSICAAAEAAAGAAQVQRALGWVRWLPAWLQQRCLSQAGFRLCGGGNPGAAGGGWEDGSSGDGSEGECASEDS